MEKERFEKMLIDEYFLFLAEIRTICTVLTVIISLVTLIGSIWYWTSWTRRSEKLKGEIKKEIKSE